MIAAVATGLLAATPLSEGRALYEAMRYPEAQVRLEKACGAAEASQPEHEEACDLLARTLFARGQPQAAGEVYLRLLKANPYYDQPGDAPPTLRAVFQTTKESLYPRDRAYLERLPFAPDVVRLSLRDPWGAVAAVVLLRSEGGGDFQASAVPVQDRTLTVPVVQREREVRWYLEARDSLGRVLARWGSPESPFVIRAPAPAAAVAVEAPPRPSRWLSWSLGTGGLALGGAGTTCALLSIRDQRLAANTQLYAGDARGLDSRARGEAIAANALVGGALAAGAALIWSLASGR